MLPHQNPLLIIKHYRERSTQSILTKKKPVSALLIRMAKRKF
jgi:hypothetical protein